MSSEEMWTAEEAAAEVGMATTTIYTWTARGFLKPAGKRGRFNLYRLADVFEVEKNRAYQHRRGSSG
ncbi:helix-turn-helix domain-containing protein [Streptosporangium sp. NBC_01495]|uniref:helix-turn-helix domain-containing protein n=1 Tax=Streptosporangium sp. NBC_01495 TaxID=2903899 RepID=UPI002E3463C3|nr:helix-turn-helix domain-containing protein [Streptosporangium sp. NBC_01495]